MSIIRIAFHFLRRVSILAAFVIFGVLSATNTQASIPGVPGIASTGGSAYVPVNKNYTLSWSAASGTVSRYELLEGNVTVYSGTARSTTLMHNQYGRRLYKVRACNTSGCSAYSGQNPIVLYTAPGPAANFSASASSISQGGSVSLTWTPAGGSVYGAVYHITTTPPSGGTSISQTTGLSMTKSLPMAGTYSFKIVTCNPQNVGCGSSRNVSVTSVPPKPSVPGRPSAASYVPVNKAYSVSWSAASGTISKYELLENDALVYSGAGRTKSRLHSNYGYKRYKVRACNVSGCSAYSSIRRIYAYTAPGPASNFIASASSIAQGGDVTLNWVRAGGSVPGAVYHVTTTTPSGGTSISQTTGLSMTKSLSLAGTYSFKIVTCNPQNVGCGSSRNVSVTSVPPKPGVPGVPGAGGSAYVPVNKSYTLSWSAASGTVSHYELMEDGTTVYSGASRSTARQHSSYGRKLYKVRACNISGCSAYSSQNPIVLYTAPGPAANYTVSKSSVAVGENVTLSWEVAGGSVPGATYHVTTTLPSGGSSSEQTTELSMNKTLSLAGEYSFKIVVCNPQNA
ncbi:hypothetical protein, partial [Paraglaciecola sp.]|uniref:hypothetical protein n=1 Tax=Paraglaciecola sp. TaxID=1920173 RepID=UPI003EF42E8E